MIKFEWDVAKATSNEKKHGVSFEEAESVFYDEFAVQFYDAENSESEDRFLMLGFSGEASVGCAKRFNLHTINHQNGGQTMFAPPNKTSKNN